MQHHLHPKVMISNGRHIRAPAIQGRAQMDFSIGSKCNEITKIQTEVHRFAVGHYDGEYSQWRLLDWSRHSSKRIATIWCMHV